MAEGAGGVGGTRALPRLDRRDGLVVAILVVMVLFFFYQFILMGRAPLNADWLHANFAPGRQYLSGVRPHNTELDDPVYQFYPLRMEAVGQWKAGHVPVWNPRILCGSPLLADGISKPLDPLIWPYFVLSGPAATGVVLVMQFILMITGAYVLGRALGLGRAGAATAAVAYTFNLFSVTWMELRAATGAFCFFPWAMLFLKAALDSGSLRFVAAAGAAAAFVEFAGLPPFALYAFAMLAAYVLWRAACDAAGAGTGRGAARGARTLGLGALALGLGAGLTAIEALPFFEFLKVSDRSAEHYQAANLYARPISFLTYLYPNFFGSPAGANGVYVGGAVLGRPYMTATAGFVGASTAVFVLGGLVAGRMAAKGFFAALLFGTYLFMLAVGATGVTGVTGAVGAIPGVSYLLSGTDIARAVWMANFAAAMLAGAGVAALARADWRDALQRRLAVAAGAALAAAALATLLLERLVPLFTLGDAGQTAMARMVIGAIGQAYGGLVLYPAVYVPLIFAAIAVSVILLAPDARRFAAWAGPAVVAVELLSAGIGYNPFVESSLVAPEFAPVEAVKARSRERGGDGRVAGIDTPGAGRQVAVKGDFLIPDTAILYGLSDVRGDESLRLARYTAYVGRLVGPEAFLAGSIHLPAFDSPLLDRLSARWVMSAAPIEREWLLPVFSDGRTFVYENARARPRAYVVYDWRTAAGAREALEMVSAAEAASYAAVVEPGGEVLPPPGPAMVGMRIIGPAAKIVYDSPARVEVEVTAERPGILVLSDAYAPGWRAAVDGKPARVMPADAALRAVFVPAGGSRVVFSYVAPGLIPGAVVSLLSAIIICLFLIRPARPVRR